MLRIFTIGFMSRVIVLNKVLVSSIYNSIFRLGGIVYYTQTERIYKQLTLHQLIFTI